MKNHPELPVTAVAAGSAPYDWNETTKFITLEPGPRATVYLAFFFYSLQTYGNYWVGVLDGTERNTPTLKALFNHYDFKSTFTLVNGGH